MNVVVLCVPVIDFIFCFFYYPRQELESSEYLFGLFFFLGSIDEQQEQVRTFHGLIVLRLLNPNWRMISIAFERVCGF